MTPQVYFDNKLVCNVVDPCVFDLRQRISQEYGVPESDLFITVNGRRITSNFELKNNENVVRVSTKLVGGKGGFGSMLRAIGAQIEKTTNREACRDLSGRRLRDINEEKRLRKWLEGQEDREKEAAERKIKKLERLVAEPKIDVNMAPEYEKERQELPERVSAAVDAGWEAAGSSKEVCLKRKVADEKSKGKNKKKAKLWIDADLSDCSSSSEDEEPKKVTEQVVTTDSGNESDRASKSSHE
ncbi:splicing regulator SDE2 [Epargyreus clarus]|uniref:splicing regulator SDE2 n=1 Tax=Epargyreus clarus TaxID=520877 RepID=UPI003C2B3766